MLRSTLFSSAIWAKAAEGEVDVLDCGEGLGLRFWALHLWQRDVPNLLTCGAHGVGVRLQIGVVELSLIHI